MKCIFCGKQIPKGRYLKADGWCGGPLKVVKYCSGRCVKRAWHVKNNKRKFGARMLRTETYTGRKWELYALELLKGSKDMNNKAFGNLGFDIEWNGEKIDVKSKNYFPQKQWAFYKENDGADKYLLICHINSKVYKVLLMPKDEMGKCGITVGLNSKHDKFKIKHKKQCTISVTPVGEQEKSTVLIQQCETTDVSSLALPN